MKKNHNVLFSAFCVKNYQMKKELKKVPLELQHIVKQEIANLGNDSINPKTTSFAQIVDHLNQSKQNQLHDYICVCNMRLQPKELTMYSNIQEESDLFVEVLQNIIK